MDWRRWDSLEFQSIKQVESNYFEVPSVSRPRTRTFTEFTITPSAGGRTFIDLPSVNSLYNPLDWRDAYITYPGQRAVMP